MEKEINSAVYIKYLEDRFREIQNELNTIMLNLPLPESIPEVDAYVYELNSFYYRSFDEKIFPDYRRIFQDDLSRLLGLNLQERNLKNNIISSIKRFAQLYNLVKKLLSALNLGKNDAYEQLLHSSREEDRRSIELSSALRQFRGRLQAVLLLSRNFLEILDDKNFVSHLNRHPVNLIILKYIEPLKLDNPQNAAAFNKLLSNLLISQNLLNQVQKDDKTSARAASSLKNIQDMTRALAGKKPPAPLGQLSSYLEEKITDQLQYLEICAQHAEHKLFANTLRKLNLFLEDVIVILDRSQHYLLSGYQEALSHLPRGLNSNDSIIQEAQKNISDTLSELDQLLGQYSSNSLSDFQPFSSQTIILLEKARAWMENFIENKSSSLGNILTNSVNHTLLDLQYLMQWLDLMNVESQGRIDLNNSQLSFLNNLDFFLSLLGNIRADIERILASRNLARLWKDLEISVERIPLEKGKVFPVQYLDMLSKHPVQEKWGEYEDYSILYEEGDLFIIRVAGDYEEEIPYLIVGRKR